MKGLTTALLARACRTFLSLAYPGGPATIPPAKKVFCALSAEQPLEPLLVPAVCQALRTPAGQPRGYAFRLGSATYPHLKLQIVSCGEGAACVFAVDTHDTLQLDPSHPDAAGWAQLQATNSRLKEQIERAWEAEGLLTFNGLLRRDLDRG